MALGVSVGVGVGVELGVGVAVAVGVGLGDGVIEGVGDGVGVGPLYSSALASTGIPLAPPAARTIPLDSKTAVCRVRGSLRLPVSVQIPLNGS